MRPERNVANGERTVGVGLTAEHRVREENIHARQRRAVRGVIHIAGKRGRGLCARERRPNMQRQQNEPYIFF